MNLQHDLAKHLRDVGWLTFTEILVPGTGDGANAGRVDVAAVKPHVYARKDLRAYEVKQSRADFQRDVATQKWRRYLQVFHRVYFAAPTGVIKVHDVPADAGLVLRGANGWTTVKSAKSHLPPALSVDALFALLYRGYEEHGAYRDLRTRMTFGENGEVEMCRAWGHGVARRLREKKADLEEPLVTLLGIVREFMGSELELQPVEVLTRRLRDLLAVLREFERNGEVLGAVSDYLGQLRGRYGVDGLRGRGESLLEKLTTQGATSGRAGGEG